MNVKTRFENFAELGVRLKRFADLSDENIILSNAVRKSSSENPWFTIKNIQLAISALAKNLESDDLEKWIGNYPQLDDRNKVSKIGVVMAGNIPAVGFHDFLCVLMSGNSFIGKLSSDDKYIIPAFAEVLKEINPEFGDMIRFTESKLEDFDAVIATGSDNTSRYFEYYFGKYPNIIRRNRNSIAVLNGKESDNDYFELGKDIFIFYGLGCRNVSKLFVNGDFDFERLFNAIKAYAEVAENNKYINNYNYYKTIYSMSLNPFMDNGFALFKQDDSLWAPVSVVNYSYYDSAEDISDIINTSKEKLQCVVGNEKTAYLTVPFGKSQSPELWDYADGVDTMKFLLSL